MWRKTDHKNYDGLPGKMKILWKCPDSVDIG